MENTFGKQLIEEAITNQNLSDEEIKTYLSSKSLNEMDLINKINNELYNDNSQQISIEKIQKICRKEDNNNSRKIWNEKRSRLLNNLSNPQINEINSKEKRINIILDNKSKILDFKSSIKEELETVEEMYKLILK